MDTVPPEDVGASDSLATGEHGRLRLIEQGGRFLTVAGALGSVAFTLRAGQRNPSFLLKALFVAWVLAPFAMMLLLSARAAAGWPRAVRVAHASLMLVIPFVSLVVYGAVIFGPPRAQPAGIFLIVPVASGLLVAVVLAVTAVLARKSSRQP